MQYNKIVIFGASVTHQDKNQQGVVTGYVPNLRSMIAEKYGDKIDVRHFGLVSAFFDTAAWLYLDRILEDIDDKTIVLSEWHTTALARFDARVLGQYFSRLTTRGCQVINLVLPYRGIAGDRECVKQTRDFQRPGIGQLNLNKAGLDIEACLRDLVHTTEYGGRAYAGVIMDALEAVIHGGDLPHDDGPTISSAAVTDALPDVTRIAFDGQVKAGESIRFGFDAPGKVQIFAHIKRGPHSPTLLVDVGDDTTTIETWNEYSYYVHSWSTLTNISPQIDLGERREIVITVSPITPDYEGISKGDAKALAPMQKIETPEHRLDIAESIYITGLRPTSVIVAGRELLA